MIVWDQDKKINFKDEEILNWRSYTQEISIPRYIEDNANRLREKYAAFIYDLGESVIRDKRIIDHLNIDGEFSFWWMSHLSEKNPFKSPRIYDCLRLLALEEILNNKKPESVTFFSSDKVLSKVVKKLCFDLNINFIWKKSNKNNRWTLRRIYHSLPHLVQGLLSLRYLILKWPLRKLIRPKWFAGNKTVFFCSYFFNLDVEKCDEGIFYSRQWEKLPEHLHDTGSHANWIHHFLTDEGAPDSSIALNWLNKFNFNVEKQGCHSFLETYLTWKITLKAIKNWFWLNIVSLRLRKVDVLFTPKDSSLWLWPVLKEDWKISIAGSIALNNCLWLELFDAVFKDLPYQKTGVYLWENQGWETALIHCWNRYRHGKLIGVPHATVVFWHLNNFDDPRILIKKEKCDKPLPHLLAVNGKMAWNAFVETGYPVERLAEVEALRFQYLYDLNAVNVKNSSALVDKSNYSILKKRMLVLGDFTPEQTHKMLMILEEALKATTVDIEITLKPHPVCSISIENYKALTIDITDKPIVDILQDFDIAFSSNTTSAGLDALLSGLNVFVFLDDNDFNHSPLRGIDGVKYVSSAKDIAQALQESNNNSSCSTVDDFFYIDPKLKKWDRLLEVTGSEY